MSSKFIIYQLLLRVFGNVNENCVPNGSLSLNGTGKFSSVNEEVLAELKKLAVTHIWYTGVIEHVTKSSFVEYGIEKDNSCVIKGEAGSPYAIKDYYDVNPYLADSVLNRMEEFNALVERTHNADLKVIIDFIPNHLARGYNSDSVPEGVKSFGVDDNSDLPFSPQNNFYYLPGQKLDLSGIHSGEECGNDVSDCKDGYDEYPAKATGNDCFLSAPSKNDWYETVKLNYGVDYQNGGTKYFYPRPKTWDMMLDVLLFWASKGVDGFRCDMAEMVPVEFWNWAIAEVKRVYPNMIFVAEVYNPAQYNSYIDFGGFDYLYDKVGLYDNLKVITQRFTGKAQWFSPASSITNNWQVLGNMQHSMLNFLENHDEQRVASDFNIGNPFKAIPELVVSLMLNTAPFMLYFGQEFGEQGMLEEGFSGLDGRTSIFDYCSAPSVVRWLKGLGNNLSEERQECRMSSGSESVRYSKCSQEISEGREGLTDTELELYTMYKKLFNIAMGEKAIKSGITYDLEYANFQTQGFNPNDHFVFARKADNELIFIVVDFSQSSSSINVKVPGHMLDFFGAKAHKYEFANLLADSNPTDSQMPQLITIYADAEITIPMNKYGVGILKVVTIGEQTL